MKVSDIYIVKLATLERLHFQFIPEKLPYSRKPKIGKIEVPGQNLPGAHYSSGESGLDLEIEFYTQEEDRADVIRRCKWLEALCWSDRGIAPPQLVRLVWGRLYRDQTWYVSDYKEEAEDFHPDHGLLPVYAKVKITLERWSNENLGIDEVLYD